MNKDLGFKAALPAASDAATLDALQKILSDAHVRAAAATVSAGEAAKDLPKAQTTVVQAQQSISGLIRTAKSVVAQLETGLPQVQTLLADAGKLLPEPKALEGAAAVVADASKLIKDSKRSAGSLAKASGPTDEGLKDTGTLSSAQSYITSAEGKLPEGGKALADAAGKLPELLSLLLRAKEMINGIQPLPDGARDLERLILDAVQTRVAGAGLAAEAAAAVTAANARTMAPAVQQKIDGAVQTAR